MQDALVTNMYRLNLYFILHKLFFILRQHDVYAKLPTYKWGKHMRASIKSTFRGFGRKNNHAIQKGFIVFAVFAIIVAEISPLTAHAFAGGSGTSGSPYQIASCADWLSISDLSAYYTLTASIDCSANGNAVIIGNSSTPFGGTLDGGRHTITVNINSTGSSNIGLFGYAQNATISKLNIAGTVTSNSSSVGMLAGTLDASTVDEVTSAGTVSSSGNNVGGLFGRSICSSTISNSSSSANVTGSSNVGGISGRDIGGSAGFGDCGGAGYGSTITNTSSSGIVNSTTGNSVGGLIGTAYDTDISHGQASGTVHGIDQIGGLVGYMMNFGSRKIFASQATGAVSGRYSLGGLAGEMPGGEISQSFATGNVSSTTGDDMGGLVGRAVINGTLYIRNSYARGSVSANSGGDVGSIIGYGQSFAHIINSYGTGTVTSAACGGGLHGCGTPAEITNSFWDTQTTGKANACSSASCSGTGATTAQMKTKTTFTNASWNFTDVWGIDANANNGYPYLKTQLETQCVVGQYTSTTGKTSCNLVYLGNAIDESDFSWQARYRKVSDTNWTSVTIDDATKGRMIFRNLAPNTEYYLSVKPTSNIFNTWASIQGSTLGVNSDVDNDGTIDSIENNGPNNGDIDGDGVLDSLQHNVSTISNSVTGAYNTLITDCSATNNISSMPESSGYKDAGFDYLSGLLSFTATGCGSQASFTQYFFGNYDTSRYTARKYNATTHTYTTIPGAALSNVAIGGQSALKITYSITDNSSLDESPVTGTIIDPSGPGQVVVAAPNTGLERTR